MLWQASVNRNTAKKLDKLRVMVYSKSISHPQEEVMETPTSNQQEQSQTELREFDLMATEKYRHLPVREVAAMLESGEIPSKPIQ